MSMTDKRDLARKQAERAWATNETMHFGSVRCDRCRAELTENEGYVVESTDKHKQLARINDLLCNDCFDDSKDEPWKGLLPWEAPDFEERGAIWMMLKMGISAKELESRIAKISDSSENESASREQFRDEMIRRGANPTALDDLERKAARIAKREKAAVTHKIDPVGSKRQTIPLTQKILGFIYLLVGIVMLIWVVGIIFSIIIEAFTK